MTNYERQQLAVEWLRDFARANDATAEGKHAARVLLLVDRILDGQSEARAEGYERAKADAAAVADEGAGAHATVGDRIRALRPAEPAAARPSPDAICERCNHAFAAHDGHTVPAGHAASFHCSQADGCRCFVSVMPTTPLDVAEPAAAPSEKACPRCGSTDFRCADHELCATCTAAEESVPGRHPYEPEPDDLPMCTGCAGTGFRVQPELSRDLVQAALEALGEENRGGPGRARALLVEALS